MPAIKTILFPTDFSETSAQALEYVSELANDNRAKLVALHVLEPVPPLAADGIIIPMDLDGARNAAQHELSSCRPTKSGVNFDRLFREGLAATKIVEAASEVGADLIVMGTHGRSGIRRLLLGSVAEQVLRQARCPVLFVKHDPAKRPSESRQ